ncbi:MAG: LysR family transcriptional regulator [Synechococcales cyanobacterium]
MRDPKLGIKLSQLRALLAVAEHGNFSEAALMLSLSQSAISHAIASLEEELGVMLFQRGRQGAVLTPVGQRVVAQAQAVMQSLQQLVAEANLDRGLRGGQLRVSCFRSVAAHVLPGVIAQFRQRFPLIDIVLREREHYVEVEQDLHTAKADVGFLQLPCATDLQTFEVLRDEYVVIVPQQAFPAHHRLTWNDLTRFPLITAGGSCTELLKAHLERCGQSIPMAYTVREDSTLVGMVAKGLGAGLLPSLAAQPLPAGVQMFSLPVRLERRIGVAIWSGALHSPAVYAFLDEVQALDSLLVKPSPSPPFAEVNGSIVC